MTPNRLLLTCCLLVAALAAPTSAGAVAVPIDSAPLNVFLGSQGNLQVRFEGTTSGEFTPPASDDRANAGFMLGVDITEGQADHWGVGTFVPVSQDPVSGSGTAGDPYRQVTRFTQNADRGASVPTTILITQTATYVAGATSVNLRWDLLNQGQQTTIVRPQLFANLRVGGSDNGVGFLEQGPPRVVGGVNQGSGASGGILEVTPWFSYEEDHFSVVTGHAANVAGPGLTNSVSSALVDNGVAVQFADTTLVPNQPVGFEAAWRFTQGGAAPPPPTTIDDLPDPTPFREVNVEPIRGQVLVKLPPGASAARYGLRAEKAQNGFIPLTGAVTLPVRTLVNTNKGRLKLESAASSRRGVTQTATFDSGTFQIIQKRARRPITEMVLKGGSFRGCPRARSSSGVDADDSQRRRRRSSRVRRLWGDGRGRFRTRGRYSSATVRGTKWLVEDRCDGTLTRLPRRPRSSRVDVRDLVSRRTVRLRAGRSYLARPRSARR